MRKEEDGWVHQEILLFYLMKIINKTVYMKNLNNKIYVKLIFQNAIYIINYEQTEPKQIKCNIYIYIYSLDENPLFD